MSEAGSKTKTNVENIQGDLFDERTLLVKRPITFYVISRIEKDEREDIIAFFKEAQRANWVWVDINYKQDKDEYRYYFHTETKKVTAVHVDSKEHGNSYFKVIGLNEKTADDRLNSVKFGVKLHLQNNFKIVTGEHWKIPKNRNSLIIAEETKKITATIKGEIYTEFKKEQQHEREEMQKRLTWGEKLKDIINFQKDFEAQNVKTKYFTYKGFEPVSKAKIKGVEYRFNIDKENSTNMGDDLKDVELIVSDTAEFEAEAKPVGLVTDFCDKEGYINLSFQSTVDYGKFPKAGILKFVHKDVTYEIQEQAVDDLITQKAKNKNLLDILINGNFRPVPDTPYEEIEGLVDSQEKAINYALNCEDFFLVQGPPGTGKTSIIVKMIERFINRGEKVLVSSKNNLAVDNVLEKCSKKNYLAVRLGREERVKLESVKPLLIDNAAIELQNKILKNCSQNEMELLNDLEKQEKYIATLNELENDLKDYFEKKDEKGMLDKILNKRIRWAKLKNYHHYISLWFTRLITKITKNKEALEEKEESYNKRIESALDKDDKYNETKSGWDEIKGQISFYELSFDEKLSPFEGFKELDYKNITEEEFYELLQKEKELKENYQNKENILKDWIDSLQKRQESLYPLLLSSVKIVGATCIGIETRRDFKDVDFDVAIIDEAGQITIFDILVPMARAKKVILIGDHMQLPPVPDNDLIKELKRIKSLEEFDEEDFYDDDEDGELEEESEGKKEAAATTEDNNLQSLVDDYEKMFKTSLFELLYYQAPENNKEMLDNQFRMHPKIAEFISNEFYEGKYQTGLKAEERELEVSVFNCPLYFFDTVNMRGKHEKTEIHKEGHEVRYNPKEGEIVAKILLELLVEGEKINPYILQEGDEDNEEIKEKLVVPENIGIITPYKRQKETIIHIVKKKLNECYQDRHQVEQIMEELEIDSVDSFQGRDKTIILYSFTRSNKKGIIGFLKELRRLNVAMTRAKYMLMLIGDSSTLCNTPLERPRRCFQNLIDYVKKEGIYSPFEEFETKLMTGGGTSDETSCRTGSGTGSGGERA
ncbi:DEAD/DEAH box helicase [Natranaerofaba carboxydovora]|uniref:DEAD/DEAH box helicase n=1 Tax=Natranaerofaba carboxydovora TaxID=2742683 RepID=UPI001F13EFD0|nr:AAA domain-containing protein [Natranaerofaba carboxydovora]UMZ73026.1 AAA domain protein [Natranaerofaba carboxydovora]